MEQQDAANRLTAVRQKLAEWQVDAVLITSEANRRWLSGFTGSNGQLLVTSDSATLATDFRYFERARIESPDFVLFKHQRQAKDDRALFESSGATRIGLEQKHVTLEQAAKWRGLNSGIEWVELPKTIEPLRAIKSAAEMKTMRKAAAITDQTMVHFPEIARPGMSEKQCAWELEKILREAGADDVAFPIIVASGPNSALPHHSPTERPLQAGDVIIVDLGAKLNGYHCDMTRSFYLGDEPSEQFWEVYHLVNQANENVFKNLKPDMPLKEVDALARDMIYQAGHEVHFGHGLGHGVGLEIHEDPFLSPRAQEGDTIVFGMTVTIEPGVYIPGWGGIRIEEFSFLLEDGLVPISQCPKQPIIPI